MTQLRRRRRSWLLVVGLAGIGVFGSTSPVLAHADLVSSNPAPSVVLEQGPEEISLDFTERVTPIDRSIEVFNQQGERLDIGKIEVDSSDPTVVVARDLPQFDIGQYVVAWRVLSGDGHVAQGAFTFQIGTAGDAESAADIVSNVLAGLAGDRETPPGLEQVRYGARFAVFVGLSALFGTLLFAIAAHISGRRLRLVIIAGWIAGFVGTALHFLTQGPYALGGSWAKAFNPDVWSDVWATRNGKALVIRLVLLGVFAGMLILAHRDRRRIETSWWRSSSALVGAAVIVTMSAAGHPSASSLAGVAVGIDAVHLSAVIIWVGGLLAVMANRTAQDGAENHIADGGTEEYETNNAVVIQFSQWATVAVPIAAVTGLWQTWHLLPSWDDLGASAWGQAMVVKTSFVVAAVTIGGIARWLVVNRMAASIRRLIVVEVAVVVAILVATTALVSQPPRVQAEVKVFSASLVDGTTIANVTVTPARAGVNEVHLTVQTPNGSLSPVAGATMRFTKEGSDVPPLAVPVEVLGPNHFSGSVSLLSAGPWSLELLVQVDAGTITRLTTVVDIAG